MRKFLLLSFLCIVASSHAWAQDRTITGKVTSSEDSSPLPGVNVVLKGSTTGTVTNAEGAYTLSIPASGEILIFSFIGFQSQEVAIGGRTSVDVSLAYDVTQLGEVVVTAVGIERTSKSLGYAVQNVNSDKLIQKSEPDPLRALQGKVPGLSIAGSSGLPGSSTRITMRGNKSFFGNNQPLIVVDGIPFNNDYNVTSNQLTGGTQYSSRIADLDPNNIESITTLPGGAAAALYGVRASNGVIVIKTRAGGVRQSRKGLEVTYSSSYSTENIANLPDYQNKYGTGSKGNYAEANGSWGAAFNRGQGPGSGVNYSLAGVATPNGGDYDSIPYWSSYAAVYGNKNVRYQAYPNNMKDFFKTGQVFENSISVSGGGEKSSLSAVVSRMNNNGYIPNSEFNRINISVGGQTVLENKLTVGGSLSYIKTEQSAPLLGNAGTSALSRILYPGRSWDISGQPYENPADHSNLFFLGSAVDNPYWSVRNSGYRSTVNRTIASVNAAYDFTDWLSVSYKIGINSYTDSRDEFTRKGSIGFQGIGQFIKDDIAFEEIESNLLVTFNHELMPDLKVRATLGHNINQRTNDRQAVKAVGQVVFDIDDIDNYNNVVPFGGSYSRRRLYGVFGDVGFNYKEYLFLNVTGRNDWTSTLPVSKRSFFYPSVSASFVFSDALQINSPILSSGKIRAGWSKVGNDAPVYSLNPTFAINGASGAYAGTAFIQDVPFLGNPGAGTNGGVQYDPKLTPEFTTEIEIGTDLGFWNDRVKLNLTYYDKRTTDQIAPISLPSETGYVQLITNFGELSNKGIEIGLDVTPVSLENSFEWNIFTSFTKNKSTVEKLIPGVDELILSNLYAGSITPKLVPGKPYGALYGTYNLKDDEGNFLIDPATGLLIQSTDFKYLGNPNPKFLLGITNTFRFKGISLSALFDIKYGGDLYSYTNQFLLGRGVTRDTEDREGTFIVPGVWGDTNTGLPILQDGEKVVNTTQVILNDVYFQTAGGSFAINSADEISIWDATVYRLREVSLAYDFPKSLLSKTPFGSASISVTGRNLWYWAPNFPEHSNYDPEANSFGSSNVQGIEYTTVPTVKRFGVNVRITF